MAPLECYLEGKLFATAGSAGGEVSVPGTHLTVNYSGDDRGADVSVKNSTGKSVTSFAIREVGREEIVRIQKEVNAPLEKGQDSTVKITKVLKLKRT